MNRSWGVHFQATVLVAFFFVLFCAGVHSAAAEMQTVRVRHVLDGDTLILRSGERLRLRGIDAPEVAHGKKSGQYFGKEARKHLFLLVRNADLFVKSEELTRDRYGRLLGILYFAGGQSVNMRMLQDGAAFAYAHRDNDPALEKALLEAQRAAIDARQGFWSKLLCSKAASQTYIGSRSSKRFHAQNCPHAHRISRKNRVVFSSLRAAFWEGFAPARGCTPWPEAR